MAMTDKELLAFLQQVQAEREGTPPAEPEIAEQPAPSPEPTTRSKPKNQKKPKQPPKLIRQPEPEIPPQPEIPAEKPVDLDEPVAPEDDAFFDSDAPQHSRLFEVLDAQESEQPAAEAAAAVRDTRLRDAVIGLILVILAAIGVWTLVQQGIAYFRHAQSDDAPTAAWAQCILPLTVIDAPAFSSPDELTDEQFLTAAVWCLITDGKLAAYETDTDLRTVPAADVIAAGNARFGTSRSPACSTIAFTGELRFYYDADQKCFLLPADPKYFGYLPEIETYTAENGVYRVTAAYRPEQPSWYQSEGSVVKRMTYTLTESGGFWQIKALEQE